MEITVREVAGFGGGLLLCAGIVVSVAVQVRYLLMSSSGEGESGGEAAGLLKGFKAFLMVAALAVKTFGAGVGVWLLLFVWRLPLGAVACGLFGGLALTIVAALLISRQSQKNSVKKH